MALKFVLDKLDGLDEVTAKLYTKNDADGKYYLDVDGAVSKSKVDEFRQNNIDLMNQVKDFQTKYKDVDLEKYQELLDASIEAGKKKMVSMEDVDNMVAERVQTMQKEMNDEKSKLTEANNMLSRQLETLVIDSAIRRDAASAKVLPSAVDDVMLRAKSVFKVEDGKPIPKDSKGNVIYGKNGTDPMTPLEWVKGLAKDAGHLFEPSAGGGAGGGRGGARKDASKMSSTEKLAAGLEERSA